MKSEKSVIIVRDRKGAGGGIFNYYQSIVRYLNVGFELVDVGRSHEYYSGGEGGEWGCFISWHQLPTPLRLLGDWVNLTVRMFGFPDLVHVNACMDIPHLRSLRRDAVNILIAKAFRRRVLVFWRGWDNRVCGSPEFPRGNGGWMSRIYRLADAHIVLASDFRDDLRRWGFETPIFLETTVAADSVAQGFSARGNPKNDNVFNILFLSRVEVNKGVFEMLDAFGVLETRSPGRYRLTVAGDGPALAEMKSKSCEMGLKGIDFIGYVDGKKKVDCFNSADAFCFLSYSEGMPNAVLEAMIMGLPLVSSDAGGLKDILKEGETGFILQPNFGMPIRKRFLSNEVADKIEILAGSPEVCRTMGERNRRYANDRFPADKVASRLSAIYRKMFEIEV